MKNSYITVIALIMALIFAVNPVYAKIFNNNIFVKPEIIQENNILTVKIKENPPENLDAQRQEAYNLVKAYLTLNLQKISVIWQKDEFSYGKIASVPNIYIKSYLENEINDKKLVTFFTLELIEPVLKKMSTSYIPGNDFTLDKKAKESDDLRQKGDIYRLNYLYDSAVRIYLEAINLNQNDAISYYWLGKIYLKQENPAEAINSFKKAIEIDPNFVAANKELLELNSVDK